MGLYSKLPVQLVVLLPQCLEKVHALQSNVTIQYFFNAFLRNIKNLARKSVIQPVHSLFCCKWYVHCKSYFLIIKTFVQIYAQ